MDMYKKKNIKFDANLCLGRNLRAVERSTARAESRHTRFSLLRCLDDDDSKNQLTENNDEAESKIPTFGKPNLKAPKSRAEMLQKWKEEKQMKRQQELKSKKPTFKAGFVAPKPVPTFPSFAKTTNRIPNKTDSRIKTSADSRTRFDNKSSSKMTKETSMQPSFSSKSQASSSNNTKLLNNKVSGIQSSNRKIPATGSSILKVKQESHIQLPNKTNTTLQKPSCISTKQIKNQENQSRMPTKSQVIPRKPSYTTTAKEVNNKLPSSPVVPKLTDSRNLKPPQALSNGIPRKNLNKIPEPTSQTEYHSQLPNKSKTTLQKPSLVFSRQTKTEPNSVRTGKGPEKTAAQIKQTGIPFKNGTGPKPQSKSVSKIGLPAKKKEDCTKVAFGCELSHIEPAPASKGFLFQPPTELSFSFLEGGFSAIFSKLRAGTERTSTPKRADLKEIEEETRERTFNEMEESSKIEVFSPQVQDPGNNSVNEISKNLTEINIKGSSIDTASEFGEEKNASLFEPDSQKKSPKRASISKLQTREESCHVTECISEKLEAKNQDPILNIHELILPVFEGESPLIKEITTSKFSQQPKSDLLKNEVPEIFNPLEFPEYKKNFDVKETAKQELNLEKPKMQDLAISLPEDNAKIRSQKPKSDLLKDEVPEMLSPLEFPECKKNIDVKETAKQELNLEKPKMQDLTMSLPEEGSSTFEEKGPVLPIEIPSNAAKLQMKDLLSEDNVSAVTRHKPFTRSSEIKTRSFRRSEMPPLESINESLENSSLLESPPKPRKKERMKKSTLCQDFTPRRSLRLSKLNEQFDSPECLFDVRPSFYATPPDLRNGACSSRNLTYDFDNLHLEVPADEEPPIVQQRPSTRRGKVSLLYTPPPKGRVSSIRKSIKGDLMSFSPDA